jgi:hypothetical protein
MNGLDQAIKNISLLCKLADQYIKNSKHVYQESLSDRINELNSINSGITENVKLINSHSFKELLNKEQEITDLFFKILPSFNYDRSAISYNGDLEKILDPKLNSSHHLEDIVDPVTHKRINETLLEAHFSIRLGVQPEKIQSTNEAYFILDRFKERLGVLKPAIKVEASQDNYGASEIREAHLAEVANSALDKIGEFEVVPHTELFEYQLASTPSPSIGSFQFYVKDAPLLYDCLKDGGDLWDADYQELQARLNTEAIKKMVFQNFEEFALLDMLTANNDRHFKNTLFSESEGKLVAIDNGNSFPWCHNADLPTHKMRPLHWFRWRVLPHAQSPFSEGMTKKIKHLEVEKIEKCMRMYLMDERVPSSTTSIEKKVETFYQRLTEIQRLTKLNTKISDIAISVLNLKNSSSNKTTLEQKEDSLETLLLKSQVED